MSKSKRAWTRITPDANGTPRYVIDHRALLTEAEKARPAIFGSTYPVAIKRAATIGGRKYSQKGYPRGIVFSTADLPAVEVAIMQALMDASKAQPEPAPAPIPVSTDADRLTDLLALLRDTMAEVDKLLGK